MPSKSRHGYRQVNVELPIPLVTSVETLAEANGRYLSEEVEHALTRHVAHPPTVRVVVEEEPPPPVEVQKTPDGRRRKRK